jgi:hypothetical protein
MVRLILIFTSFGCFSFSCVIPLGIMVFCGTERTGMERNETNYVEFIYTRHLSRPLFQHFIQFCCYDRPLFLLFTRLQNVELSVHAKAPWLYTASDTRSCLKQNYWNWVIGCEPKVLSIRCNVTRIVHMFYVKLSWIWNGVVNILQRSVFRSTRSITLVADHFKISLSFRMESAMGRFTGKGLQVGPKETSLSARADALPTWISCVTFA